jgi:hypothetical protein
MDRIAAVDTLKQGIVWIALAACLAPVWGTLLWELWDGAVRPRLIRRDIIDRAGAAILAEHGERAEQMALIAEHRAWRYSDPFKQGGWRRIRKRIAALRREREGGHSPPPVMRGLDPRIHPSSPDSFEEDGLPGQARQRHVW